MAMYEDKFKEGLASLPWNLSVVGVIALLIFLLSGNYAGNAVRCAVFDSSGCLPRLNVSVEATHVAPDKIQSLVAEKRLTPLANSVLNRKNDYKFYRFDIHLDNVGVSNVEEVLFTIAVYPRDKQRGKIVSKTNGLQDADLDEEKYPVATEAYRLTPGFFRPTGGLLRKEVFDLTVLARLGNTVKVEPDATIFEVFVKCEGCQVQFERMIVLHGDLL